MVIASFNCNSIRARMPLLLKWMQDVSPDVVCLQETKVRNEEFPESELSRAGYHSVYMGEKSYNGVAVLSKIKAHEVFSGFDGKGSDEGTRLIYAVIEDVAIVNTYIPQGNSPDSEKFAYKLQWFERLESFFRHRISGDYPLIWLGDFNVAPEPIDVHSPDKLLGNIGYHPDEHEALDRVKHLGFVDIFRKHRPTEKSFTFWDYRVRGGLVRDLGWRIDHIWGNKKAADKSVNAWIDREPRLWEKPSDHTPIVAEFRF